MKVLVIETSHDVGCIGLGEDDRIISKQEFTGGLIHGQEIMPAIERLFRELNWKPKELNLIVVSSGPGSYTGVRIGMATAKTLAYALDIPCVRISTLDAIAVNAPKFSGTICPVMDARREQVYGAFYNFISEEISRQGNEFALTMRELLEKAPRPLYIYGNKIHKLFDREKLNPGEYKDVTIGEDNLARVNISIFLGMGYRAFKKGDTVPAHLLNPVYIRPTEAELKLKAKEGHQL